MDGNQWTAVQINGGSVKKRLCLFKLQKQIKKVKKKSKSERIKVFYFLYSKTFDHVALYSLLKEVKVSLSVTLNVFLIHCVFCLCLPSAVMLLLDR